MYTILVVDDESAVCRMWKRALTEEGHRALVASSIADAERLLREPMPELDGVVLDLALPDGDGRAILHTLRSRHPLVPIAVVSGHATAARAIELWSQTTIVVQKPLQHGELLSLVTLLGDRHRSALAGAVAAYSRAAHLGRREQQVLEAFLREGSSKDVAFALGLKEGTVSTYLQRIFRKTGHRSLKLLLLALFTYTANASPLLSSPLLA